MDCCSTYPNYNRNSIGGQNGTGGADGLFYHYNNQIGNNNPNMRYLPPGIPGIYRNNPTENNDNIGGSSGYSDYNERFSQLHHTPPFNINTPNGAGYFNDYHRESSYFYHPYENYHRYPYHHKEHHSPLDSIYNRSNNGYSYSSSFYHQRDHNNHHYHSNNHNIYPHTAPPRDFYNSPILHQQPTYVDTDSNQHNSSCTSSTYNEYPPSPTTSFLSEGSNHTAPTQHSTVTPSIQKETKNRKTSGREKGKTKSQNRKTISEACTANDSIDRCSTPFINTPPYSNPNDNFLNYPFNGIRIPQNNYMTSQPLPSNCFNGPQTPWNLSNTQSSNIQRSSKKTNSKEDENDQMLPPSYSNVDNLKKTESLNETTKSTKSNRPIKRTKRKPKQNNSNATQSTTQLNQQTKLNQKALETKLKEINQNVTPLPGFQQAFGSTEIGRFSEAFFNVLESPFIDQIIESEADTLSPQPWETGDSLEGPHINLQIGGCSYSSENYCNINSCLNESNNLIDNNINNNHHYNNNLMLNNNYFREIRCNDY